jgi:hypothetical protein
MAKFLKLFVFLFYVEFTVFAQCPQIANVEVISNNVSCFGLNNGSIRVSLKDSSSLSTNKFYFVLYSWSGTGLNRRQTLGVVSPKYSATFTGLSVGSYDILIARTAGSNTCTTFPLFSGNNPVTIISNTNTTFKPAFVKQMDVNSALQIYSPLGAFAGNYSPILDSQSMELSADDPASVGFPASVGTWSVASGSNIPKFSNVNDPNAKVSDLLPGEYIFKWTLKRAGCPDRSDLALVVVEVTKPIENDFNFKKKVTKIVGKVFYDRNKNGKHDETEDFVANQGIVTDKEGFGAFTDNEGKFELILTEAGNYKIGLRPRLNFELSPEVGKMYEIGSFDSLNFYVTPINMVKPDLMVDITPVYPFARPNEPYILQAEVSNIGGDSGGGKMVINLPKEFVLDSVPKFSSKDNVYVIDSLLPSKILRFLLFGHIAKDAKVGVKIAFSTSIKSNLPDVDESNNQSTTVREIVDVSVNKRTEASTTNLSNNVVLVQIDTLSTPQIQNNKELTYTIYFQNDGTKKSNTLVIYDSLSTLLDLNTIDGLSASRLCVPTLSGGVYCVKFPNINLPASIVDLAKSFGFFKFNVKAKKNPIPSKGTIILNKAAIYFDSTNFKNATKAATLVWNDVITRLEEIQRNSEFSVYPNPNSGEPLFLNVAQGSTFKISNMQGEAVMNGTVETESINIAFIPASVYLLETWNNGVHKAVKLVKQ